MQPTNDHQRALSLRCRGIMTKLEQAGGNLDCLEPAEAEALMDMISIHQEQEHGTTVVNLPGG